jgi:DNA-binding NarL/FixJ family response regulator
MVSLRKRSGTGRRADPSSPGGDTASEPGARASDQGTPSAEVTLIERLTLSELRVVGGLAAGVSAGEIAQAECVSVATIRSRITSAKQKTGARTLPQLVAMYSQANVIPDRAHSIGSSLRDVQRPATSRPRGITGDGDLASFLDRLPERPALIRRAANAADELRSLLGRPPENALIAAQVAVGLESSQVLRAYMQERTIAASISSPELQALAFAFAEEIVAAFRTDASHAAESDSRRVSDLLTPRQLRVVGLLANGLRYRDVAEMLAISERQVRRHVVRAVDRLNVRNTNELIAVVISNQHVPPDFRVSSSWWR